jgi:large subunit ribosomal protein L1
MAATDLMPNPKTNTVTEDVDTAVKLALGGAMSFRNDRSGSMRAGVGKKSWKKEDIMANIRAYMMAVTSNKPKGAKGKFIRLVYLGSTMGKSYRIFLPNIDPASPRFMRAMDSIPMNE